MPQQKEYYDRGFQGADILKFKPLASWEYPGYATVEELPNCRSSSEKNSPWRKVSRYLGNKKCWTTWFSWVKPNEVRPISKPVQYILNKCSPYQKAPSKLTPGPRWSRNRSISCTGNHFTSVINTGGMTASTNNEPSSKIDIQHLLIRKLKTSLGVKNKTKGTTRPQNIENE